MAIFHFLFWLITFWLMSRVYFEMLPPHIARRWGHDGQPLLLPDAD